MVYVHLKTYWQRVHFESTHKDDNNALKLQFGLPRDCITIQNSRAGDCLYKAISQSLYGVKDHHREIHLWFIWMVKNKEAFVEMKEMNIHYTIDSVTMFIFQVVLKTCQFLGSE